MFHRPVVFVFTLVLCASSHTDRFETRLSRDELCPAWKTDRSRDRLQGGGNKTLQAGWTVGSVQSVQEVTETLTSHLISFLITQMLYQTYILVCFHV